MNCSNCGHSSDHWKEQACPQCGVPTLKIAISEKLSLTAEFTAEGKILGETTGIRHDADTGRSVTVDLNKETSSITGSIRAPQRLGETGSKEVCERLLQRLNQDAGITKWERCECVEDDKSEKDCIAHAIDGSSPLKIQVTRGIPGSTGVWNPASRSMVEANYDFPLEQACTHIKAGIQKKACHYGPEEKENLLLAVDMLETPGHALEEITRLLDAAWIASLGFREIWLVGLMPSLCARLHPR